MDVKTLKRKVENMDIKIDDKVIAKKRLMSFGYELAEEGEMFEVYNVDDRDTYIKSENKRLTIDNKTFDRYFDKYVEPEEESVFEYSVASEFVSDILEGSEVIVDTLFDKCTMVACKLPNGFVIVETSACVDPDNYDEELGINICLDKITDKIYELEGYVLQNKMHEEEACDGDCENCEYSFERID